MTDPHSLQLREKRRFNPPAAVFDFLGKAQSRQGSNAGGKKQTACPLALRGRLREGFRLKRAVGIGTERLLRNSPVEGRDMQGVDLPTLRFEGIQLRPKSQLGSTKVFGIVADALLDVIAGESQWTRVRSAPQRYVTLRMVQIDVS